MSYTIVGISAYPDELKNFMEPLLIGARQLGHQAAYMLVGINSLNQMVNALRQRRPDFCLLTGRTVSGLAVHQPKLLEALRSEGIPLVYLWYDNPLRYTWTLAKWFHENVLFLTTVDTSCIPELQALGFDRLEYSPFIIGPVFRPLPPVPDLQCEFSFTGGYMTQEYLEEIYIPEHYQFPELRQVDQLGEQIPSLKEYRRVIDGFVEQRRKTNGYVDAYAFLRAHSSLEPKTKRFASVQTSSCTIRRRWNGKTSTTRWFSCRQRRFASMEGPMPINGRGTPCSHGGRTWSSCPPSTAIRSFRLCSPPQKSIWA